MVPSGRRGRRACLRGKRGAWRHLPSLYVAGMALGDMDPHFKRGRCDKYGIWWCAWFPVDAAVAAPVCVAGVALGDICHHFAWQV